MKSVFKSACLSLIFCGALLNDANAVAKYPVYYGRDIQVLDGSWSFAWLGDADLETLDPGKIVCNEVAAVPGVFDTALDNFGKRGTGIYRRKVMASAGLTRLKIGGLGLYAKIWWDSRLLGEIKLPYASIDMDFENPSDGEHILTIAVDNRFSEKTAPLFKPNYDFYAYGGIYRSVAILSLPEKRIEGLQITTLDTEAGRIRVQVRTAGVPDGKVLIKSAFDAGAYKSREVTVSSGIAQWECVVPDAKVWSPEIPHLHTLSVAVGNDRMTDRFGIRTITTEGRTILLNGKPLRLKGVNRHESHPEFGPVQNTHLMMDDIRLVKMLNANFIRCVHYQHDPEFYELCDENGILVWAESLGWGLKDKDLLANESLILKETRILGRVVANHPSVIIAGFLNECASDKESCVPLYRSLVEILRETTPGALVSYGSNKSKRDLCFGLCDIISLNYYPGWIYPYTWDKPSSAQLKGYIDDLAKWFDDPKNKDVYDKPLITSETGACGVYGVRDRALAQWSEDYQADYFVTSIKASMSNPRFCGVVLWELFDTRSYVNTGAVRGKYRGYNNAGLVDEYRRPKMVFDEVQKVFKELK